MANRMFRNAKGQFTTDVSVLIYKQLMALSKKLEENIKPQIRDELERSLVANIYASRTPATKKGQETKKYNETHKHQKARPYHHTGTLEQHVHARIRGNVVVAGPDKNAKYEKEDTPVADVYNYLKYGTPKTSPKGYDKYYFNGKKNLSPYISQRPHDFEARTSDEMREYMKKVAKKLESAYNEVYTENGELKIKYIDISGG